MNSKSIMLTGFALPVYGILSLVLFFAGVAGCTRDHEHRKIDKDSPEFCAVAEMLDALRSSGISTDNFAPGIDAARKAGLIATLQMLNKAETVELLAVDEFGTQVYRATFKLNGEQNLSVLLVRPEGKDFYWAGKN